MAILRSNGVLITDGQPTHTPADNEAILAFVPADETFWAFQGSLPWVAVVPELGSDVDFSSKSSFKLPVSATPTVNANGEIALDTTVTDISHGLIKYYGAEELVVIAVPLAQISGLADGDVIKYNATTDEFEIGPVPTATGGIKQYKAYWTQSGTDDPLLQSTIVNDFGTAFTLDRPGVTAGIYTATLVGAFPDADKFFPLTITIQSTNKPMMYSLRRTSADAITIEFYDATGTPADLQGRIAIAFEQHP